MTITNIFISIVALIAVIGGGAAAIHHHSVAMNSSAHISASSNASSTAPTDGKKIPFSAFAKKDGSYKCDVNINYGESSMKGTTYLDNGMIRAEYTTNTGGYSININSIVKDGFAYSWTSMSPTMGFKSKVATDDSVAMQNPNAAASGSVSFNLDMIGDYNCQSITADASLFTPPSTIIFKDTSK